MELKEKYLLKLESDPLFILRRRLLTLAFSIRMFFIGVEYSVILPSCLLYMKTFNVSNLFMGLVVAAYPFAGMLSLPIVGRLYDKTKRTKELIIVLNFLQIVGNIIYAIPFSRWLPLTGRFLAGLGDGFLACAVGEITYVYPKAYRTGILSIMELGRVMGLIIGPAITFFIGKKTYYLWTWRLDYATLPGVIMACGWILYELLTMCFVFNLSKDLTTKCEYESDEEEGSLVDNMCDFKHVDPQDTLHFYNDDTTQETDQLVNNNYNGNDDIKEQILGNSEDGIKSKKDKTTFRAAFKEMFSLVLLFIFYVDIILWLVQTEFEILLPFVTEFDYGWSPKWTGTVYMIGGAELILIFLILYYVGSRCKVRDTYFLIFSSLLTMGSSALLVYEGVLKDLNQRIMIFAAICFLVFTSIPFNLVASKALLSKIFRPESQGFIQGFYASVTRLALIGGPILGSLVFYHRQIYGIVACVASFISVVGLALSVRTLNKKEDDLAAQLEKEGFH